MTIISFETYSIGEGDFGPIGVGSLEDSESELLRTATIEIVENAHPQLFLG